MMLSDLAERMRRRLSAAASGLALALLVLAGCAGTPATRDQGYARVETAATKPEPVALDTNLARLSEWFAGEWNNYEQVSLEKEAAPAGGSAPIHEHIHAVFKPVSVPAIGGSVFYARQTLDDNPERLFRLRLYRFAVDAEREAIRLDQYSFVNEKAWKAASLDLTRLEHLRADELRFAPDCAVWFKYDAASERFVGSTDSGRCKIASERLAKAVTVEDRIELGAEQLAILSTARDDAGRLVYGNPQGVAHQLRRVRYFEGWVAINTAGRSAKPEDKSWRSMRQVRLHSEGRIVPITWEDGRRSGYSVQLARLTYQGDKLQVLVLKLLDDATGQSVSYAWTDPDGKRLGINLRWFQAGFAQIATDWRFAPSP